jgi:DNA-binding phage protein
MIRDYVLASIGYTNLAKSIGKKPESVMRMLSDKGNPTLKNMAALLASLQRYEGIELHVAVTR